ncbi:MAG: HD domain-containing phosphohydrolase, partial [Acidobacteriota bacterium]
QERVDLLVRAAALHELGRLASRPEETERLQGRPESSGAHYAASVMAVERLLAPIASLRHVREIILRSAEWFDAASDPLIPDGAGVPIESRILATCEEFVALSAGADDAVAAAHVLKSFRKRRGRKHDPEVVAALVRVVEAGGPPGGAR